MPFEIFLFAPIKPGYYIIFKGLTRESALTSLFLVTILALLLFCSGCISSSLLPNTVPNPDCEFTENISDGVAPLTVQFSDPCPRAIPIFRHWSFGDGNSSDQPNPVHTYVSPGIYEVAFTIYTGDGYSTEVPTFRRIFVSDHLVATRNWTQFAQPSGYWIKLDSIGDKHKGEIFAITATTNLTAGEDVIISVYHPPPYVKSQSGCLDGAEGQTKVTIGRNGVNTTSFDINLSCFRQSVYYVIESGFNENTTGNTRFNITS